MAKIHGKEGIVKIGANVVAEVTGFTVTTTAAIADASAMGDDWDDHLVGRKNWSGSITCFWDKEDATGQGALVEGAAIAVKLYPEGDDVGSEEISGTATITQVARTQTLTDTVSRSFDFTGKGAMTVGEVAAP